MQLSKEEGDIELEERRGSRKNLVLRTSLREKSVDEIEHQPSSGYDEQESLLKSPGHDPSNRGEDSDNTSVPAMESVPRYFKASWPSTVDYLLFYIRPGTDIWVVCAMIFFYLLAPRPTPNDSVWWAFMLNNKNMLIWIPFTWRLFRGFFHWILSHVILPGPILYNEGPLVKFYPKFLVKSVEESFAYREYGRARIVHAGGIPISLLTPDGVLLDAMYFKGQGTDVTSPTVIRFNGNAEAYELQDDVLPRNYTANGINIILFNYRGVGRSRWQPVFKSDLAGWLIGFWRTPTIIGTFLDTCTLVEYATKTLGVEPTQLVLLGHSIGGAIATQFAARNPSVPLVLCSSRSFANLVGVAVRLAPSYFGIPPGSPKAIWMKRFAYIFLNLAGWEYDRSMHNSCTQSDCTYSPYPTCRSGYRRSSISVGNWKKVTGFKWIEYSSADHIIPYELSLHAVLKAELDSQGGATPENMRVISLIDISGMDNHNRCAASLSSTFPSQAESKATMSGDQHVSACAVLLLTASEWLRRLLFDTEMVQHLEMVLASTKVSPGALPRVLFLAKLPSHRAHHTRPTISQQTVKEV